MIVFFHGFLLSFGLILPLGIQNVFIFNQGVFHKRWVRALPAVLTACICDTFLILLAVLGVSIVVFKFAWLSYTFGIIGFIFIIYMGWMTWKSSSSTQEEQSGQIWSVGRQIGFAASVSLLNPHAIMDTIGVIGTSALAYSGWPLRIVFMLGCVATSWMWFFALMTAGNILKSAKHAQAIQKVINRVSAIIMWVCALLIIKNLIFTSF